jgi:AbrB family looped-hinge helix DNA binding protein
MRTTFSTKGQIILPVEIRRRDHIKPGQEFEVERMKQGNYQLTRASRPRNEDLVKLLLACPGKGWFRPVKRTERTNDVKTPTLG